MKLDLELKSYNINLGLLESLQLRSRSRPHQVPK